MDRLDMLVRPYRRNIVRIQDALDFIAHLAHRTRPLRRLLGDTSTDQPRHRRERTPGAFNFDPDPPALIQNPLKDLLDALSPLIALVFRNQLVQQQ